MKKQLPGSAIGFTAIIFCVLITASCKKSDSGNNNSSSYYMRFKLNGVQTEYTSDAYGSIIFNNGNSLYTAVLIAYKDVNAGLKNALTFTLFNNTAINA